MKMLKSIIKIITGIFAVYLSIFIFWLLLGIGCMENHSPETCRDNSLSRVMSKTHQPIIELLVK
jgi:hypothetical protein